MPATTIKIYGDATDAIAALRGLGIEASAVESELGSMAEQATLNGAAVAAFDLAVEGAKKGLELAVQAMQRYVATSPAATREQQAMRHALDNLSASFGAAVLGGGNAEVMFGAISRASNAVTIALQQNDETAQQLAREAMALLIDGLGLAVDALNAGVRASDALSKSLTRTEESMRMHVAVASDMATSLANLFRRVDRAPQAVEAWQGRQQDLNQIIAEGDERTAGFTTSLDALAQSFANAANDARNNTGALAGYSGELDAIIASHATLSALLNSGNPLTVTPPRGGGAPSGPDIDEQKRLDFELAQMARQREMLLAEIRDSAKQATVDKQAAEFQIEKELAVARAEALLAIEESAADKRIEIARREQRQAEALLERRQSAAEDYAASAAGMLQDLAAGQEQALAIIASFVGQELIMKGTARMMEGAAMLFVPGQQANGAGLIAAGGAMVIGGAVISSAFGGTTKGAGGMSAASSGAAPLPASASSGNQTNVQTNVTFGVVGDQREAARTVADLNKIAIREGMQ